MMGAGYGRKRILAVDDAAFTLSRITDALGKHYEMITVNSGTRALKYLDKNKPDLILLDIRMPVKDGFEILREIRSMEDRADIPIIMLTAMEDRQSVMRGIELGICDYVLKPFAPDDLLERVQRILRSGISVQAGGGGHGGESGQAGDDGSDSESSQAGDAGQDSQSVQGETAERNPGSVAGG